MTAIVAAVDRMETIVFKVIFFHENIGWPSKTKRTTTRATKHRIVPMMARTSEIQSQVEEWLVDLRLVLDALGEAIVYEFTM